MRGSKKLKKKKKQDDLNMNRRKKDKIILIRTLIRSIVCAQATPTVLWIINSTIGMVK